MCNIKLETYNEIIDKIGNAPIESGGILGMKNDVICAFFYDENAKTSCDTYIPDIATLNEVIKNWNRQGVKFVGIVHSHANGYDKPSHNDELYAKKLLEHNSSLEFLIFPILTIYKGNKKLSCYEYANGFIAKEMTIK